MSANGTSDPGSLPVNPLARPTVKREFCIYNRQSLSYLDYRQ